MAPEATPVEGSAAQVEVEDAPLLPLHPRGTEIPGQYIVVYDDRVPSVSAKTDSLSRGIAGIDARKVWSKALKGFVARLTDEALAELRKDPDVAYVEPDQEFGPGATTQNNAPWHLDRVDQTFDIFDDKYIYDFDGTGVNIYIVDSGVRTTHDEFGTRASAVYQSGSWVPADVDCLGHGTAVASAAAGDEFGVAKNANIKSVRIDDCVPGTPSSEVVDGMDWIADNHVDPAVVNFSYQHQTQTVADAVDGILDVGVAVFVLAGNADEDACHPVTDQSMVVVSGAVDSTDTRSSFSNYGDCLDLWAPGEDMTLADSDSDSDTDVWSGTSFASPMAAGVAAIYLDQFPGDALNKVVHSVVGSASDVTIADKQSGSPSMMLYSRVPRVFVDIDGPDWIHTDDECVWQAEPRGGRLPYTYAWSGVLSGSNLTIVGSVTSPGGGLTIEAEDAEGNTGQFTLVINSKATNPQVCPD